MIIIKKKKIKQEEYIDKLMEWQDHQFDPGYYTGSNLHPIYTLSGRPKLYARYI